MLSRATVRTPCCYTLSGMTNPGAGLVRLARAGVLTGLVVLLTVVAHRLGGGTAPGALPLVVLGVLLWPLALYATRRRVGPAALLTGLAGGQLLGHGLLSWLGGSGAHTSASVSLDCLQHAAHGVSTACASGTLQGSVTALTAAAGGHAHSASGSSLLMLGAHAVATVVAALVLARGEQVLWRVLELLLRALPVLVTPVCVRIPRASARLLLPSRLDRAVRAGRGPPAYAA